MFRACSFCIAIRKTYFVTRHFTPRALYISLNFWYCWIFWYILRGTIRNQRLSHGFGHYHFYYCAKSKFLNYLVFYSKLCEKSQRLQNRPTKLTLSSTLLQSSHNNYWKAWKWGKYKLCSKSAKSSSPSKWGSQLLGEQKIIKTLQSGRPNTLSTANFLEQSDFLQFLYFPREKNV